MPNPLRQAAHWNQFHQSAVSPCTTESPGSPHRSISILPKVQAQPVCPSVLHGGEPRWCSAGIRGANGNEPFDLLLDPLMGRNPMGVLWNGYGYHQAKFAFQCNFQLANNNTLHFARNIFLNAVTASVRGRNAVSRTAWKHPMSTTLTTFIRK